MNLEALSIEVIKEELTGRGVSFHPNLGKSKLIALLKQAKQVETAPQAQKAVSVRRKKFTPSGEFVNESLLRKEVESLPVRVFIAPVDRDEGKSGWGRVSWGSEGGSFDAAFKFNKSIVMPEVALRALETRTMSEIVSHNDDPSLLFRENAPKNIRSLNAYGSKLLPRYAIKIEE